MTGRAARVVVAVLALAALSCGREEAGPSPPPEQPSELDTVRMNLGPIMAYAPAVIAKREGNFTREGIDLEFVLIDANSALLAIATGDLDVMANPIRSGLFNMITRGVAFQIVADDGHYEHGACSPDAFVAPPALADRVGRSNLRGQRFGFVKGGITEFLTTRLLAAHGLTPEDVELVEYPAGGDTTGQQPVIEAIRLASEPNLSVQVGKGLVRIVANAEAVAPGQQRNVLGFGARLLHEDPDLGRRFMRAWLRGVRRYNEGPTDSNVAIISEYTHLPPGLIRNACWPRIAEDGRVHAEAVLPILAWSREKHYLDEDVPVSAWWNPRFVDEATRDLAAVAPVERE